MTQLQNQFRQGVEKGMLDLRPNFGIETVQLGAASSGVVPGQFVKMATTSGGVPKVVEIAADSDEVYGVVVFNPKKTSYVAYDYLEVAPLGSNAVIYLEASAAIARNAVVMPVVTGSKVATAAGGGRDCGHALDVASASGDLVRVKLAPKTTVTA